MRYLNRGNTMRRQIIQWLFYPTLCWSLFWAKVVGKWKWWNRVDQHVILGALPFSSSVEPLYRDGVRAVVNTCEEYAGPVRQYNQFKMEQLRIPTLDFTPPTLDDIHRAVNFMQSQIERGQTVYVHCKAGRGRSATVVLCWLMLTKNVNPQEALAMLQVKRPHVVKSLAGREVVQQFYQQLIRDRAARKKSGCD